MLEEIDTSIKEDVGNVVEVLKEAVCNAIDKKVNADSGINSSILNERLKNLHDWVLKQLDEVRDVTDQPVELEVAVTSDQIDI